MNITKYKKYKLKPSKQTLNELCNPKKYELQPQQKFLAEYLYDNKKINGLLIYHQIGSGKTCTAINIAEKFKHKMNIVIVLPAALIGNFRDELRTSCPGHNVYMTEYENKLLKKYKPDDDEYIEIINKSNERIDKYYNIYSYHKFVELVQNNKIKLKNSLLIIDEIQNMISMSGTFYKTLLGIINKTDDTLKTILLSATPMFDRPVEIALTLNLLKPKSLIPIGTDFNNEFISINKNNYEAINLDKFKELTKGLISYYRGALPITYPEMDFKVIRCNMSNFQYRCYLTSMSLLNENIKSFYNDILKLPGNFFLGPRMISNIAFPNKKIGELGFSSLEKNLNEIENFSIKFYKIYNKIKKSDGPIFVYSNFKDIGGLKSFIYFIEYHGYKNYKVFGEGSKRYSIWSGDETHKIKEEIKHVFNQKENSDGSKIKIMLGSPAVKEGISFLRVEQVHILEPYWNLSRIKQIIGRAVRFCSHKDLPKEKRIVNVYLYLATHEKEKMSIDEYIWNIAKRKNKLISQFEHVLKENAIDCELFHARNSLKGDEQPIQC